MKKTAIALLLITVLCAAVFAQTEADFQVELTDDGEGVVIIRYIGKVKDVRIPATIQGMPVKEIFTEMSNGPNGAFMGKDITSVVIPEGITLIPDFAFSDCASLRSVTLPSTLKSIGKYAFQGCRALTSISLPKGLTEIDWYAFDSTGLTSLPNPWPAGITDLPNNAFSQTKLRNIVIPEGIKYIGMSAFEHCNELTSVTLPSTIKSIEDGAFGNCKSLTTVIIPQSVRGLSIGYGNFDDMSKLTLASQAAIRRATSE